LGHAIQILANPERYFRWLWLVYKYLRGNAPDNSFSRSNLAAMPVLLRFPQGNFYFAMPGEQVRYLFKTSTNLVPTPSLLDALTTFFGLPTQDAATLRQKPEFSSVTAPLDLSRQIMQQQRRDFAHYLQGPNLELIIKRFASNLLREFDLRRLDESGWVHFRDLYGYMTSMIFRAEVEALYGEHIFQVCPTMNEDFWNFYESLPIIAKKAPKWLAPSSYAAQRKMQDNFSKWRIWCTMHSHPGMGKYSEYEPLWGCRYVRAMVDRFDGLGFSPTGVATAMFGFLFV
jgi:hypothetical protein